MIAERLAAVRERIARAAARAGRSEKDVALVAISKTHGPERVREAYAAGVRDFGENKVQEALPKVKALEDLGTAGLCWHLVGHLQSNKARKAALAFDRIDSVEDAELALRLDQYAGGAGKTLPVLVQVDLAGEATKHGTDETRLFPLLEKARGLKALEVRGLMTLPPFGEDPEKVRPFFRRLRQLRDLAAERGLLLASELSMGMSHDFEVAIEEGATQVRIGTAIFGERHVS